MLQGFVTIGKAELIGVLIAFVILGAIVGALIVVIRNLVVAKPAGKHRAENRCTRGHLDVQSDVDRWLSARDFSLITNELLSTLSTGPVLRPAESGYLWHENGEPIHQWPKAEQP